jgi:dUTP pyrophosphatase
MEIKVKKLKSEAIYPSYAHVGDAGLDLFSAEETFIKVGDRVAVSTGLALAVPNGYVGLVWDKSGLALKQGLTCLAGVLDSGYRGELLVVILNIGNQDIKIKAGQKIAQLLIQPIQTVKISQVNELEDSYRGVGGFGSTGLF